MWQHVFPAVVSVASAVELHGIRYTAKLLTMYFTDNSTKV
jgi:hypothetical protein